jgi:nitroimidazol reductase NimA-like FMN-containing flavoprotein (pyridoxamine 5'-phosphate oxidase superfamily)/GNAT superfamily N-acetyltransferase
MEETHRTPRTTVKRMAKRAAYDREVIHSILDRALVCHVGFVADGAPSVLPTLHARIGDRLYLHGSVASHMLRTAAEGAEICVTVTMIDGLVLARSAFHHSVNYRSAVIFGRAQRVDDRERKLAAMRALVEHVAPGRWAGTRAPNEKEINGTLILELPIEETSAKIRTGGPIDDEADYALPFWAGVIPLTFAASTPVADPRLDRSIEIPPHIFEYRTPDERAPGLAHDGAPFEKSIGEFLITTDVSRLDLDVIHRFLSQSYWAAEVPREVVARALKNSLCFGLYDGDAQIGLARVVSDYATFAYVADVFVLEEYRGRGLSKALMAAALAHPHLQGLRRWTLATRDAHGLYRKFGFDTPQFHDRQMERADLEVYRRRSADAK